MQLLLIALGGGAGAVARYLLGGWVSGWAGGAYPWGTLVVNLLGCLSLGGLMRVVDAFVSASEIRALVGIGFLGAFTTFSTFSLEAVALIQRGEALKATAYVAVSVLFGLLGVWIGMGGASGPWAGIGSGR
jgi:fluoride exporter